MDLHLIGMLRGEFLSGAAGVAASALVAGLWQGTLLCAATGLLLKAVPVTTARQRFLVWTAVFCVSAGMPFAGLASAVPSNRIGVAAGAHWVLDPRISYVLASIWLIAGAYRVIEFLLQGFAVLAIWKAAVPVAAEALSGLDVGLTVGGRKVEICTSSEVDRPSVIGFLAPRILIPEWLFPQLTATELRHIVLHEMEHLKRRDDWVNLLQKIGLVLLPLNPALFWIDRRLSTERELACDDGVLERTKAPRAYAASLTSVAERRLGARSMSRIGALALAATGLMRRRSELGLRIESILGRRAPMNRALAGTVMTLLVIGILGSAAWLAHAPQLVSFAPVSRLETPAVASGRVSASGIAGRDDLVLGARVQTVSFRMSGAGLATSRATPAEIVPPRLKTHGKGRGSGASEAVPLSRTDDPVSGQMVLAREGEFPAEVEAGPSVRPVAKAKPAAREQWVVLTSWDDSPASSPISRVVIATPDGRFFVAPYAAVPTQAGWLIVQL